MNDKIIYSPLKTSSRSWKAVTSNDNPLIPPPEYFTNNNLHLKISFGKCEVEEAARTLLCFFAQKKRWDYFTLEELQKFCDKIEKTLGSALFGLICPWCDDSFGYREPYVYIVQANETEFCITTNFIKRLMPNGITRDMIEEGKIYKSI